MSQENVNVVKSMYAAFATGNIPIVIGALDSHVEWWEAENFIYADQNPYEGPDAVLEGVFMRIGNEWEGFAVEPEIFWTPAMLLWVTATTVESTRRTERMSVPSLLTSSPSEAARWLSSSNTPTLLSS